MDAATVINLLGVGATAAATVTLAVLTGKYVRLTHALVEETKAAKEPNVFIDLEFGSGAVFMVGNSGAKPALDISFEIRDNIPWRPMQGQAVSIAELPVVKHGISYLAPNRVLKYQAGFLPHDKEVFSAEHVLDVKLTYRAEGGTIYRRHAAIGLGQYSGVLYESFADPSREIARAIKDTESRRHSRDFGMQFRSRFGKKTCPTCGETVAQSAKKCPHCLEAIKEKEPEPDEKGK